VSHVGVRPQSRGGPEGWQLLNGFRPRGALLVLPSRPRAPPPGAASSSSKDVRQGRAAVAWSSQQQQQRRRRQQQQQYSRRSGSISARAPLTVAPTALARAAPVCREVTVAHLGPGVLEVRDPWGSAYIVREAGDATPAALQAGGISEVLLPCHLGAAVAIGRCASARVGRAARESVPRRVLRAYACS
jgi:hypothetical protein